MKRYAVKTIAEGKQKYYYIEDQETFGIVLSPSKFLKHKIDSNRSPNTVRRTAFSLCYYMEYLAEKGVELSEIGKMELDQQSRHFVQFLYWLKEGRHITEDQIRSTGNGTCNAYLKDVFRFFFYLADCGEAEPLKVFSYDRIMVTNAVGVRRAIHSRSFQGYLKAKERDVRAAEEPEILTVLKACTNSRDQLLLLLLAETGFRIGELLGVDYTRDIDYQRHTISVAFREDNENCARAKNAEYRKAKISDDSFAFLMHYLSEYRKLLQYQKYLFINIAGNTAGRPMNVDSVYDMLGRMEKKTGIRLTPHMLRRYFAAARWDAGWPLELISQALGHKHLDTTIQYLGILDERLMEASREFYARHSAGYGIEKLL